MAKWYVTLADEVRYPGHAHTTTVGRGGTYVEAATRAAAKAKAKKQYPGHRYYQPVKVG